MTCNLCLHGVSELPLDALDGYAAVARTSSRERLLAALRAHRVHVLVIDLDAPDAVADLIAAREADPSLGVVGLTAANDFESVVAAQRAGCQQFARVPIDVADLADALARCAAQRAVEAPSGTLIALIGSTGGTGVTTLAAHLAVELATVSGDRVALLDLDLDFGGAARAFDLNPAHTLADVCRARTIDAEVLTRAAEKLPCGVGVLARPATIHESRELDDADVQQGIVVARAAYPYVVLDLPHKLDGITGFAVESCDKLLIVMQLTVPSVDNARRLIEALEEGDVPLEKVEIIVNRYRKAVHSFSTDAVEKLLKRPVFGVVPNDYQAVRAALDTGKPLAQRNPVRAAIADVATRIVRADPSRAPQPDPRSAPLRGALARLVGSR